MDSLTMGELVGLMKDHQLTLDQVKKALGMAIEKARAMRKNGANGGFKTKSKLTNKTIARYLNIRTTSLINFLRPDCFLNDTLKNRQKLLEYILAALKAGLTKQLFVFILGNFHQFSDNYNNGEPVQPDEEQTEHVC